MGLLSARKYVHHRDGTTTASWDKVTLYRWLVLAGVSLAGDGWTYEATVIGSILQLPSFISHLGYADAGIIPDSWNQWLGPIYTLGQLFGGLIAALISDKLGRKAVLYAGSVMVLLSTAMLIGSPNIGTILAARVIQGCSIGFLLLGYQVYAVELASRQDRGFVSGFSLITGNIFGLIGSCIIYGVSYVTGDWGWRFALAVSFFPSAALFIILHFVPESPRWLHEQGRTEEARFILGKFHGFEIEPATSKYDERDASYVLSEQAQEEFDLMTTAINADRANGLDKWSALWNTPSAKYRLFVSLTSQFWWAWNGSSIETYYYTQVFASAGISNPHTQFGIGSLLNVTWVLGGFIGSYLLDVLGRRFAYIFGLAQMSACLILQGAIAIHYFDGVANPSKVAGAIWVTVYLLKWTLWVTFFSAAVNLLPAELWPSGLRARGFALSNVVSMAVGFATQYSALPMYRKLNGWTWILFAGIMAFAATLVWFSYPEPKGLILEEIEVLFASPSGNVVGSVTGKPLRENMAPIQRMFPSKLAKSKGVLITEDYSGRVEEDGGVRRFESEEQSEGRKDDRLGDDAQLVANLRKND